MPYPREVITGLSDFSPPDRWSFRLDGNEPLSFSYDEDADVLYLWRGPSPRPAVSLTTDEGIVVRFDEESGELVGFTILNWLQIWARQGTLEIDVPDLEIATGSFAAAERHELELVPA